MPKFGQGGTVRIGEALRLESLVNQTYKNLEIILVDDGSPDDCPKKCEDWTRKDNRIKAVHKKRMSWICPKHRH